MFIWLVVQNRLCTKSFLSQRVLLLQEANLCLFCDAELENTDPIYAAAISINSHGNYGVDTYPGEDPKDNR